MNSSDRLAKKLIEHHEGRKNFVYIDSVGVPTLGVGHALHKGSYVPDSVIDTFLKEDLETARGLYDIADLDLDPVRRAATIDMFFNLGPQLLRWKFIKRLREKDYRAAGREMINSRWWSQVGRRSKNLHKIITTGRLEDVA